MPAIDNVAAGLAIDNVAAGLAIDNVAAGLAIDNVAAGLATAAAAAYYIWPSPAAVRLVYCNCRYQLVTLVTAVTLAY
jgi:hypothetical protein